MLTRTQESKPTGYITSVAARTFTAEQLMEPTARRHNEERAVSVSLKGPRSMGWLLRLARMAAGYIYPATVTGRYSR